MMPRLPNHPDRFRESLWYGPREIGVHSKPLPLMQHRRHPTASSDRIAGARLKERGVATPHSEGQMMSGL